MSRIKQNHHTSKGFTLIEVLIIAPIVVLIIGGFVALLMAMIGDVLLTRDQNVMAYETQDALDRIEQDTRLGTQFLNTSRTLPTPQGSDDGTAAFSSSNSLILGSLATNKNPTSSDRQLIYFANQPSACASSTKAQNRVFVIKVIYYVKNGSLWRRVVVPTYNTDTPGDSLSLCDAPWQQNSCTPGYTVSPPCQTNDSEIMKNIKNFTVTYYDTPSGANVLTGSDILNASTIDVTIDGERSTSGKIGTSTGTVRATKLNSIDADIPPPTSPSVSQSAAVSPDFAANFSWASVPYATSYNLSYRTNGGAWSADIPVPSSTTSYSVTRTRGDTVSFRISSVNTSGESPDSLAEVDIPDWVDIDLQNNWENYGVGYEDAAFTRSDDGVVSLKGLVRYGDATVGTVIGTLPVGYRPSGQQVFQVITSGNASARIDVGVDGSIYVQPGVLTGWVALDGINFLQSTTPYSWTEAAAAGSAGNWGFYGTPVWTHWGGGFTKVRTTMDGIGRVHLQGLAKPGPTGGNLVIVKMGDKAANYRPNLHLYFPSACPGFCNFSISGPTGELYKQTAVVPTYMGLQAIYYPGSTGSWSPLTLSNLWVNSSSYPVLEWTKASDGLVTLRGMVKSGTTTADTKIANLPASIRPSGRRIFSVTSNYLQGRVDIKPDGDLVTQLVSNTWVALNLSYMVDE